MKAENLLKDNKTRSSLKTTETAEGKVNDKPKLDERWYKGHYWFLGSNSLYTVNLSIEEQKSPLFDGLI